MRIHLVRIIDKKFHWMDWINSNGIKEQQKVVFGSFAFPKLLQVSNAKRHPIGSFVKSG
jgi:hypothetical protein